MYFHSFNKKSIIFLSSFLLLPFNISSQEKIQLKLKSIHEYSNNDNDFDQDSFKADFKHQIAIGSGMCFSNNFKKTFWTVNFDFGFRTGKHFMLMPGLDLIMYRYNKSSINELYKEETKTIYCVSFASSFFWQTKYFMFYAGAGPQISFPFNDESIYEFTNLFVLTRASMKISSNSSIGLSVKTAIYINGDVGIPSASLMYSFVF